MGRRLLIDEDALRQLVAANRPDREVAAALGVSPSTVRRRRRELSLERVAPRSRSARATWTSSFVVRCTLGELARLDSRAGDRTRHDYVRALLFGDAEPLRISARAPVPEAAPARRSRPRAEAAPRISRPRQTQPRAETPPPPAPVEDPPPLNFGARFGEAFDRSRLDRRVNLVPLSLLRRAFPELDRAAFDAELFALRRTNQFVLESYDGRHGNPKPDELEGGIREGGRLMVYASRREEEPPEPAPAPPVEPRRKSQTSQRRERMQAGQLSALPAPAPTRELVPIRTRRVESLVEREDGVVVAYNEPVPCRVCGLMCTAKVHHMTDGTQMGEDCAAVVERITGVVAGDGQPKSVAWAEAYANNSKQLAYLQRLGYLEPGPLPRAQRSAKTSPAPSAFEAEFGAAWGSLALGRRDTAIPLSELRAALSGYPASVFDAELLRLHKAMRYSLLPAQRHAPSPEEQAAAIEDGGRTYLYVRRRGG